MNHESLYQTAMKAIGSVHNDMTVPLSIILESLNGLKDEVNILIDTVKSSIIMEQK